MVQSNDAWVDLVDCVWIMQQISTISDLGAVWGLASQLGPPTFCQAYFGTRNNMR